MGESKEFRYWKRPWQKWCVFFGGMSQVILICINIQQYIEIFNIKDKIFTAAEWENYAIWQNFQCSLYVLMALLFFVSFLIGNYSKSRRSSKMAEGVLLLCAALFWGVLGFVFDFALCNGTKVIWGTLFLVSLIESVYSFWKYGKL